MPIIDSIGAPARALGPSGSSPVGASSGPLTNLPIMRMLVDFTQGAPNAPGVNAVDLNARLAITKWNIKRGRQYELGTAQAGTLTVEVSDPGELLNPINTSSPYNTGGNSILPYRPTQLTAVWNGVSYTRFTGFVERYPQAWVDAGFRNVHPLTSVDALAIMSRAAIHQSYFDVIVADAPTLWIPYNDAAGPGSVYLGSPQALVSAGTALPGNPRQGTSAYYLTSLLVGGTGLRIAEYTGQNASITWGGDSMPDGTSAVTLTSQLPQAGSTDPSRPIAALNTAGGTFAVNTTNCTMEFWAKFSNGCANFGMFESVLDGDFDYINSSASWVGLYAYQGQLVIWVRLPSGTNVAFGLAQFGIGLNGYPDGLWHYYAIAFPSNGDGTSEIQLTVDSSTTVTSGYNVPNQQMGVNSIHHHVTSQYGDATSTISIFGLAYYPTTLTTTQVNAHYYRGIGYRGERSDVRAARLLDQYWGGAYTVGTGSATLDADFDAGVYPVPAPSTASIQTAITPYSLLQVLENIDLAESGFTYADVAGMVQVESRSTRYGATSLYTFGEGGGEYPYTTVDYDFDPTYIYSETQLSFASGGASITQTNPTAEAAFGYRNLSETLTLENEWQLFQAGTYYLTRYSVPTLRIVKLVLEPSANPSLYPVALSLDLSDRITVKRRPTPGVVITGDFYVESIEETGDPEEGTYIVTIEASPVFHYYSSVLDSGTSCVLGSTAMVMY